MKNTETKEWTKTNIIGGKTYSDWWLFPKFNLNNMNDIVSGIDLYQAWNVGNSSDFIPRDNSFYNCIDYDVLICVLLTHDVNKKNGCNYPVVKYTLETLNYGLKVYKKLINPTILPLVISFDFHIFHSTSTTIAVAENVYTWGVVMYSELENKKVRHHSLKG